MTNANTIVAVVVGIAIAGSAVYFVTKPRAQNENSQVTEQESQADPSNSAGSKKMAFSEFLKKDDGSYKCTVDQYIDEGFSQKTTGTTYLDKGKIRGDYKTSVQGMNIDSSVIVRDGYVYSWTSLAQFGTKSKQSGNESSDSNVSDTGGNYTWNDKLIGDYECNPWTADDGVFEIPGNIEFREM